MSKQYLTNQEYSKMSFNTLPKVTKIGKIEKEMGHKICLEVKIIICRSHIKKTQENQLMYYFK